MSEQLLISCALGSVLVDVEEETTELTDDPLPERPPLTTGLPLVVDADASGSRVVCVVDRRPPLVISDDAGATWRETGGGLPAGRAVAISPGHPDRIAFATGARIHVSSDGGIFWRALAVELPEITAVRWPSGE